MWVAASGLLPFSVALFFALFLLLIVVPATIDGRPDPVPQALVLTGIVIAVSTTAFALALMVRLFRKQGHASIHPDIDPRLLRTRISSKAKNHASGDDR